MTTPVPPPQAALSQMINGFWITGAIHAAAHLGLADKIAGQPLVVSDLSLAVGANPDALFRLMRALSSLGIFVEGPARSFSHTPLSEALRTGVPGSMHGLATMSGLMHLRAWPHLAHSIRTGAPAFDHVFGKGIFEYITENEEARAAFDEAMSGYTAATAGAVVSSYDFTPFRTIVDVGGGNGALLAAILGKFKDSSGISFDLSASAERAKTLLQARGLRDRCEVVGGDFFVGVPTGGDAYMLKMIIHDWDDERSIAILKNIRKAMAPGARLLVVDMVIDPATTSGSAGKLFDLNMLVMTGGRERTADEFASLYQASRFELTRVVSLPGDLAIIEGTPV